MRLYVPREIDHCIVVSIGQETRVAKQVENDHPVGCHPSDDFHNPCRL